MGVRGSEGKRVIRNRCHAVQFRISTFLFKKTPRPPLKAELLEDIEKVKDMGERKEMVEERRWWRTFSSSATSIECQEKLSRRSERWALFRCSLFSRSRWYNLLFRKMFTFQKENRAVLHSSTGICERLGMQKWGPFPCRPIAQIVACPSDIRAIQNVPAVNVLE